MASTIRIAILANAAQARKELGTVETSAQRMGSKFAALRAPAIGALAAVALGAKKAVTDASNLNETINKSSVIFGSNAASINAWAGSAAKNLGLSKNEALNAAAGFGDMFQQIGFAGGASAKMSTTVVGLAADLGSFNNLPTADVSERIAAAFRGEYDSLQALIPNINAARVEQVALAATGKKTASSLTAQEKAAATLSIVQKDGARAAGDFARTSSGAANQAKIMAAQQANLSAQLGQSLLPAYTAILGVGVKFTSMLSEHSTATKVAVGIVAGLAAAVLLTSVATTLASTAMSIWRGVTLAYTAAQWLLNAALTANPIGLVVVAIAALIAVLIIAWKNSATFRAIVTAAFNAVKIAAVAVWNAIKATGAALWSALKAGVNAFKAVASAVWRAIKTVALTNWNAIKAVVTAVIATIRAVINAYKAVVLGVWSAIRSAASAAFSAIRSAVSSAVSSITSRFNSIRSTASSVLSSIRSLFSVGALVAAGRALIQGLINGITGAIGGAVSAVSNGLARIRNLLPGSPIKDGPLKGWNNGGAGKRLINLVTFGVKRGSPGLRSAMTDALDPRNSLSGLNLAGAARGSSTGIAGGVTINFNGLVGDPVETGRQVRKAINEHGRMYGLAAI